MSQLSPTYHFYLQGNCLEIKRLETNESTIKPLHQISADHLGLLRDSIEVGFLLKRNSKYFYADISEYKRFRVLLDGTAPHMCYRCNFLSAKSDVEGGCAKVRAFSRCIEKFPFITYGYETWGTSGDVFIVLACKNWKPSTYVPTQVLTEHKRVLLAQFLWEHVESDLEIRQMVKRENRL